MLIHKTQGFTLPELLVAVAINSFLSIALIAMIMANIQFYKRNLDTNKLNQQLEAAMQLMTTEIARAGYWANAQNDLGQATPTNPYLTGTLNLNLAFNANSGSGNCILFSYDKNNDGTLPSVNAAYDDERYGFRLQNGAIQARPPGASYNCTAPASAWENITDTNVITISSLNFTLQVLSVFPNNSTKQIMIRSVDITLTGYLTNNSSITRTLTQHVRVQNDNFSQ